MDDLWRAADAAGTVVSNDPVADGFRHLWIETEGPLPGSQPGQFVQLRPATLSTSPLLRTPLSVSHVDTARSRFGVLYDIVGPKTTALGGLGPGDAVQCLGPLGNPFPPPDDGDLIVLVGGGIGVPPLLHLGSVLREGGADPVLVVGARSAGKHLPAALLDAASSQVLQATDDGSLGHHGFVTDLLATQIEGGIDRVYCCGPHPMMAAVAAACAAAAVRCDVSLEEYMACGYGVCVGCVVERRAEARTPYEQYSRVCVDGPVYDATEIVW